MHNGFEVNQAIELTRLHEADKVYVMYGEFDPFTARHEAILRELILQATMAEAKSDGKRKVAIVMVVEGKPSYSGATALSHRIRMVELAAYHQTCVKVFETMADYVFVVPKKGSLEETITESLGLDLGNAFIVMDAAQWNSQLGHIAITGMSTVAYMREMSERLINESLFIVFRSGSEEVKPLPSTGNQPIMTVSSAVVPPVYEGDVRRHMKYNPLYNGTEVPAYTRDFIAATGLYNQTTPLTMEMETGAVVQNYDPDKYPKCSVTATIVVYCNNMVLLVKRKAAPFKNFWALPGGFAEPREDIEQVAVRELKEEASIEIFPAQVKHIGVYTPDDPRATAKEGHWAYDVGLAVGVDAVPIPAVKAGDDAIEAEWVPMEDALEANLAFHHSRILKDFNSRYPNGLHGPYGITTVGL
jgi:ADP-ribose pyrophosphatase YjhB (NUDIX family)